MRKVLALVGLLSLIAMPVVADDSQPYIATTEGKHFKVEANQAVTGRWQSFAGIDPVQLGGERALFFAQLHLTCTKKPRWVKIRLARINADGSLDTTGTNTWIMSKNAPTSFQGSLWWESLTRKPIKAQFKVKGGNCYSPERQFKFWQP